MYTVDAVYIYNHKKLCTNTGDCHMVLYMYTAGQQQQCKIVASNLACYHKQKWAGQQVSYLISLLKKVGGNPVEASVLALLARKNKVIN